MLATHDGKLRWMRIDLRARWRRRVAVVFTYVVFAALIGVTGGWELHPLLASVAMAVSTMSFLAISVFRPNGVVKRFDDAPQKRFGNYIMVGSLDEWARYRYGVASFEEASKEQQTELLSEYRLGNYLVPAKLIEDPNLDERERAERDSISRWALGRMAWIFAIFAGSSAAQRHPYRPMEVAAILLSSCIMALTLPQARVLWTEPDPSEAGDLRLAEGEA